MSSAYSQQRSNITKTWLLIVVFVGFISALCFGIAIIYDAPFIAVLGFVFAIAQAFAAYFAGDKIALHAAKAREVSANDLPEVHALIENISKIADIPKPKVYISPDQSPNAFACGRDPQHASICLNRGILNILNKHELEGVIAHEISHIKNRDILIMTITMVLTSIASFISDIGIRFAFFGRSSRENNSNSPIQLIFVVFVLIITPIISVLIQLAVSRSREFLADASAVTYTRYPEGLIHALEKLYHSQVPTTNYSTAMNHFYISPPKKNGIGNSIQALFSTHPSLESRISALKQM